MNQGRGKAYRLLAGAALLLLVVAGCTSTPTATTSPGSSSEPTTGTGGTVPAPGSPTGQGAEPQYAPSGQVSTGFGTVGMPSEVSSSYYYPVPADSSQAGIWVSGTGKVTVKPDLAVLSLGVEARDATVTGARSSAADAMSRVIAALKGHGVADQDITTRYFNIQPITVWQETYTLGQRYSEPQIIGYQVTNQVSVNVRDLEGLGPIIDDATSTGGDLIRVQGIAFTVEDPTPYTVRAREAAVQDAMAKAQQFATLTGVTLGKLVYIAETGGTPSPMVYAGLEARAAVADMSTPISTGEMDITISVQAVFAIP